MQNCLGIYIENNLIKYAKVSKDKEDLKIETYGIKFFDDNLNINIIDEICKYNPQKVIFKDSSFKNDNDKINLEEKIKKISPETEVNIL